MKDTTIFHRAYGQNPRRDVFPTLFLAQFPRVIVTTHIFRSDSLTVQRPVSNNCSLRYAPLSPTDAKRYHKPREKWPAEPILFLQTDSQSKYKKD